MQNMRYIYFTYSTSHDTLKLEKMQEGDLLKMNRSHAKYISGLPVGAHCDYLRFQCFDFGVLSTFYGLVHTARGAVLSKNRYLLRVEFPIY